MPKLPAHQVTTRNLGAAYPFIAEAGLGPVHTGAALGLAAALTVALAAYVHLASPYRLGPAG